MLAQHFEDLRVYQQAFDLAARIFMLSRDWPREELYCLTSQVRRSSRSVCANIAEAWRKRRYVPHFVSKLTDADAEAAETQTWLKIAANCGHIAEEECARLHGKYNTVSGGLVKMMSEAQTWCGPSSMVKEDHVEYEVSG